MDIELRRIAYHEAGHAVATYLARQRIYEVSIVPKPSEDSLGHVKGEHSTPPDADSSGPVSVYFDSIGEAKVRHRIETDIMVTMAGPVAEALLTNRRPWVVRLDESGSSEGDTSSVSDRITYIAAYDERVIDAYLKWLWQRTRVMLNWGPHWAGVKAVAEALLKRRHISGRLARTIIRNAIRQAAHNPEDC